jgi:hypothetical protein
MNVRPDSRWRRLLSLAAAFGIVLAVAATWASVDPEGVLRLRVIAALTTSDVWAVGTDVRVVGSEVRVQGFVRSEADRARVLAVARDVTGVERVRDRMSLTAWPERPLPAVASGVPRVALLAGAVD